MKLAALDSFVDSLIVNHRRKFTFFLLVIIGHLSSMFGSLTVGSLIDLMYFGGLALVADFVLSIEGKSVGNRE